MKDDFGNFCEGAAPLIDKIKIPDEVTRAAFDGGYTHSRRHESGQVFCRWMRDDIATFIENAAKTGLPYTLDQLAASIRKIGKE